MSISKQHTIFIGFLILAASILLILIGYSIGYAASASDSQLTLVPHRLDEHMLISPLLFSDTSSDIQTEKTKALSSAISSYIHKEIGQHVITTASIYIRDFSDGSSVDSNPDEKYNPASLDKIPAMMATFKQAEHSPSLLTQSHVWNDATDYNKGILVQPKDALKAGQSYTIQQALKKMIEDSDNNAYYFLGKYIDPTYFSQTMDDIGVPVYDAGNTPDDYLTVKNIAAFFRVLFNANYLTQDDSEQALEMLANSTFTAGLRGGVPANIQIAHKFGIDTIFSGNTQSTELHDCGIVYTKNPYLICVMTKGGSKLADSESLIKTISSMTYKALREN